MPEVFEGFEKDEEPKRNEMMPPTQLRIKPSVLIPWRGEDYLVEWSLGGEAGLAPRTTLTLLHLPSGGKHFVTDPEASVLWSWLLGELQLEPTSAGVLDLTRPNASLREAQAALAGQEPSVSWAQGFAESGGQQGPTPAFPALDVPEVYEEVPRIDLKRARQRMGLK